MGRPKGTNQKEMKKAADMMGSAAEVQAEQTIPDETAGLADTRTDPTDETAAGSAPETKAPEQESPEQEEPKQEREEPASEGQTDRVLELENLVKELQAQVAAQRPQVVQVVADTEKVMMRFQAECADDNVASFGPGGMYGQVTGKTGTVVVPKAEWSRFLTEQVRYLLNTRKLIVLTGLDDDERELYGVMYQEGELLDQKAFVKLLDLGRDLIAIFPALCQSHKEMIARRFLTAYQNGDRRANDRDLILALNELSKMNGQRKGLFTPIIAAMNARDAGE